MSGDMCMEVTKVSIPNQNPKERPFVGVWNWQVGHESQVVRKLHEEQMRAFDLPDVSLLFYKASQEVCLSARIGAQTKEQNCELSSTDLLHFVPHSVSVV